MKYEAFVAELDAAGLSIRAFARLLKLNPNSITNYKAIGTVPSHLAVIAALLNTLAEHGIDFSKIFKRLPIKPNAPRGRSLAMVPKKLRHSRRLRDATRRKK